MKSGNSHCQCGHEKRDHAFPLSGKPGYGNCKVCLCNRYAKPAARGPALVKQAAQS